jgi:hypothetical protein
MDYDKQSNRRDPRRIDQGMEIDKSTFYKSYKALPLAIYIEIERLSVSKSALYKSLCAKARIVAESFHRSIK